MTSRSNRFREYAAFLFNEMKESPQAIHWDHFTEGNDSLKAISALLTKYLIKKQKQTCDILGKTMSFKKK